MRILIADDDKNGRRISELFLKKYGECTLAEDGLQAYDLFCAAAKENNPFSLVLLDVMMPGLHGTEVLKQVRAFEKEHKLAMVKIIMLTGQADFEKINYALTLGAAEYLLKPIEESSLIRRLQRLGLVEDPMDM